MSEYQFCASDFSHTHCEYNMCRSREKGAGHHHTYPCQDEDDWQQCVSYLEDIDFQEITPPTKQEELDSASLTPIDSAIFEVYTPLPVEQIGVEAYKENIVRMYVDYKQHKRDHRTNCNDKDCKTHYRRHRNCNRYLNSNFTTCSVCGT